MPTGLPCLVLQPNDLDYIRVGNDTGLGRSDLSALNVREITVGS